MRITVRIVASSLPFVGGRSYGVERCIHAYHTRFFYVKSLATSIIATEPSFQLLTSQVAREISSCPI